MNRPLVGCYLTFGPTQHPMLRRSIGQAAWAAFRSPPQLGGQTRAARLLRAMAPPSNSFLPAPDPRRASGQASVVN
jgi:hypothetical protein